MFNFVVIIVAKLQTFLGAAYARTKQRMPIMEYTIMEYGQRFANFE